MPKVELHAHLEGGTRPETPLVLARRSNTTLTDELIRCAHRFGFDICTLQQLRIGAVRASQMHPARLRTVELVTLRY
jgi:adenosine deaminase